MPHILVLCEDTSVFSEFAGLLPPGLSAIQVSGLAELRSGIRDPSIELLVVSLPSIGDGVPLDVRALQLDPDGPPVVLLARDSAVSISSLTALVELRPQALVTYPFDGERLRATLDEVLSGVTYRSRDDDIGTTLAESNRRLNDRLQEINTIYTVGKSVASSLDVDEILERIVASSVNLTQASDGFIVLRENGRLFVRVAKNWNEPSAQQLHQATSDPVAWQVIRSGRPVILDREAEIATGFLVSSLLYVPLQTSGSGTIGILGVVNREDDLPFTENQLFTLSSVADFAAIALENARLYAEGEAERSRLSAILEYAADAIIVTDLSSRLWLWSETAGRALGIDPEAKGQLLADATDNADVRDLFSQAEVDASVIHTEVNLEDGRVFNAQLSTIAGVGRVAVMQEITHLKELDRLKSEFVSTVSHDLRSPLTTIQGYVELLDRAGPLNEMQHDFVTRALNSLTHVTALISDLLDIGRIEAGFDLEMKAVRLDELIRTSTESAQVYARSEAMVLSADLPNSALRVWGNARRLRQVLDNLISNAIKYNRPRGRVKVLARTDGNYAIVEVSDTGIGIPAEEQPRIFERFYRVQSPETEEVQGTGLGLAIVKSVIEKHKGRVWVSSVPGEGSTFAFVLPIHAQPE